MHMGALYDAASDDVLVSIYAYVSCHDPLKVDYACPLVRHHSFSSQNGISLSSCITRAQFIR